MNRITGLQDYRITGWLVGMVGLVGLVGLVGRDGRMGWMSWIEEKYKL